MEQPKAFLFDVFGTVVDWRRGVATECARMFAEKSIEFNPFKFADLWRGQYQPAMERIRSGNRGYLALDILHRENLELVLDKAGIADQFNDDEKADLNRAWEKLPGWPDSSAGLKALKEKAIIAPCSNGSIAIMTRIAKYSDLPWDCILGAEIAQIYKPKPEAYLASVKVLGLNPNEVAMIAAHNDDLYAARNCGLKTGFISRPQEHGNDQKTDLEPAENWDYIAENIQNLAEIV